MPAQRCHSVSRLLAPAEVDNISSRKKTKTLSRCSSQPQLTQRVVDKNTDVLSKQKKTKSRTTKKKKKIFFSANVSMTKYNLVRQVCSDFGFVFTDTTTLDCFLIWSDAAVPADKIAELKSYQKINHFAGMGEICRKDSLSRNIWRVQRLCPDDFNFVPQSWVLPGEYAMFQFQAKELKKRKRSRTYIRKPVNGAMGHGIWLTRNPEKIAPNESCIVQEYLDKPMLMDGFKFDLRMYVFVMSCNPLKIFLYKDGLVRMGTERYTNPAESNITSSYMHLTNYSINKHSENFVPTSKHDLGSKRTLKYFWKWLEEKGENVDETWSRIADTIIKTILVAMPHLFHAYHMCRGSDPDNDESCCFEILGFDIFIDRKCKPWVLEVNRAPSFGADQDLDYEIKYGVLSSALKLLNIKTKDRKRCLKAEKIEVNKRLMAPTCRKTMQEPSNLVENKKKLLQKRKKDLKWRLNQIRRETAKREYEDKHTGEFVRIYPPATKPLCEYYAKLLGQCNKVITGRTTLRKSNSQLHNLKEEELLDLLQEVENDVLHIVDSKGKFVLKGPVPLSSMPASQKPPSKTPSGKVSSRLISSASNQHSMHRQATKTPATSTRISCVDSDEDEEKINEVLQLLLSMKIKYPGKSEKEGEEILEQIQEHWEVHRTQVAAYWLVKLDAFKRKKVIDIVKGNVTVILRRVWNTQEIESVPLYRTFTKLFNRLLWSHGQGLWNCFKVNSDSWESIFFKSTEKLSQMDIQCCRQVVKLCRDCLLVVYQFASESQSYTPSSEFNLNGSTTQVTQSRSRDRRIQTQLSNGHLIGAKITRLYK